jgi:deferrochelatase/peroxidase EfeB
MSCPFGHGRAGPSRRSLLAGAGGLLAGASVARLARAAAPTAPADAALAQAFFGAHQAGIATSPQTDTYFVAFDLVAKSADEVTTMLRLWTDAAARMTAGETARPLGDDLSIEGPDGGSALGLKPSRLTLTFGFGPGLFTKNGVDRYGLAARRPDALVDLPRFNGDQLQPARTGGDISVQACANDPQVAFHALRELDRLSYGLAQIRWAQAGFLPDAPLGENPRNLMGFKDGTVNPPLAGAPETPDALRGFDDVVWVGDEGPDWMRGGSYMVARRIRISLDHWDRSEVDFQEQVIGRHKYSGAPIGKSSEQDPLDLDRVDKDGNPLIPDNAHVRLGAASVNDGAQVLRRSYSYNDGVSFTAERWPPWRQGMLYDAGLLFIAYQRDPRLGFIKIYGNMSKLDALNQFTTHTGGGLFACPAGVREGEFIGQRLFGPRA